MSEGDMVRLLWALYPCTRWTDEPHGATVDCDCEEYLEGVFLSVEGAKSYIPLSLDARDDNVEWKRSPVNKDDLLANTGHGNLYYLIQAHLVTG